MAHAIKIGNNNPMVHLEHADFVVLDTSMRKLEALFQATGDEKWVPPKALREMVNQGYVGEASRRKASKGGYYEFFETTRGRFPTLVTHGTAGKPDPACRSVRYSPRQNRPSDL